MTKCLAKSYARRAAIFWCCPLLFTPPGLIKNEGIGTARLPELHLFWFLCFPQHKANRNQPGPQLHCFPWTVTISQMFLFSSFLSLQFKMLPNMRSKTTCQWHVSPGIPDHISMLPSERKADYQELSAGKHTAYSSHWCMFIMYQWKPRLNVCPKFHVYVVNPLQFAAFSNYISKQLEGLA